MPIETRDTPGWKFYQRHVNYFVTKDVDGLVANDYNDDAKLIAFPFTVQGREALRKVFTDYLNMIGDITLRSTENFTESDDTIFLEATMDTSKAGERRVYDVFVLRNGKIQYHFTGLK